MAKDLLTDRAVRNAKAADKPYRLFDGDGLALWVSPIGAKSWQLRYRLDGKDQTATLGKYPKIPLAEAREDADKKRKLAAAGEQLTTAKRVQRLHKKIERGNTFDTMATHWAEREARRQKWTPHYVVEVDRSIRRHLSDLDGVLVATIKAATLAPILQKVERSAPMMLEKVRRRLNAILDYAVEHGAIDGNPLPTVRRGRKIERRHYPAVTDLAGVGEILRAARAADPCKGIQRAHVLLAFTALRVSEVVGAKWAEFDLDGVEVTSPDSRRARREPNAGNWRVPRERMKRKDADRGPHVVPLPPALLEMLREWHKADGVDAVHVCPAPRDPRKTIVPEACEKFYRNALDLGGKHSPRSWRSAFSTVCREAGKDRDAVESQLDHIVGNKTESAYDRAQRLELRRALLTWYETTLIAARDGAKVVKMGTRA
jgi:integrase